MRPWSVGRWGGKSMSGLLKPSETFRSHVVPNYEAYWDDPTGWKADNLVGALNNHAEWVYYYYSRTDTSRLFGTNHVYGFRKYLWENKCPEIQMIWNLADALKHRHLDKHPEDQLVAASSAASDGQLGPIYITEYRMFLGTGMERVFKFWKRWKD